eukprot:1548844-Pleurochrysis_carterae.AAC.9
MVVACANWPVQRIASMHFLNHCHSLKCESEHAAREGSAAGDTTREGLRRHTTCARDTDT